MRDCSVYCGIPVIPSCKGKAAPGILETILVESALADAGLLILIVDLLKLGWRDIADRFQQASFLVPADLNQCGELHIIELIPASLLSNDFCSVQAHDRLGVRDVVRISQERRSVCGVGVRAGSMFDHDSLVDLSGEEELEASDEVACGEVLGGPSSD